MRIFRRRPPAVGAHIGIELRISNMNGELVRADSDHLYYSAKYGGAALCTPACPPRCDRHGWLELVPGDNGMEYMYPEGMPPPARIKIEIRPVRLSEFTDQHE